MNASLIEAIEDEIEESDVLIKAAEDWSKNYRKDPTGFSKLIRNEAKYQRALRKLFRDTSKNVADYIDWTKYNAQIDAAFKVETIVSGDLFDGLDSDFLKISYQFISTASLVGVKSAQKLYKFPLGAGSTSEIVQQLTVDRLAYLVGKVVYKGGKIVDNPKAEYRISDRTRNDIMSSIKTSISLGETKQEATSRLTQVVDNPARAEVIAQTETVNAHARGVLEYGQKTGATGKESLSVGSEDYCQDYADEGIVPLDYLYGGTDLCAAYHVGCRCGQRLVYANEYKEKD